MLASIVILLPSACHHVLAYLIDVAWLQLLHGLFLIFLIFLNFYREAETVDPRSGHPVPQGDSMALVVV